MSEPLQHRFDDQQLKAIINQAMIYMCACPAQVAEQLQRLRALYSYQRNCIAGGPMSRDVHEVIAGATARAHAELEDCLDRVLDMEGWDRATLAMPAGLRHLRDAQIDGAAQP